MQLKILLNQSSTKLLIKLKLIKLMGCLNGGDKSQNPKGNRLKFDRQNGGKLENKKKTH